MVVGRRREREWKERPRAIGGMEDWERRTGGVVVKFCIDDLSRRGVRWRILGCRTGANLEKVQCGGLARVQVGSVETERPCAQVKTWTGTRSGDNNLKTTAASGSGGLVAGWQWQWCHWRVCVCGCRILVPQAGTGSDDAWRSEVKPLCSRNGD